MKKFAQAQWQGAGKNGKGTLSTKTDALNNASYTFASRFEDGKGTNPEELIAAAHAGCYCMKLSFDLEEAGFDPNSLDAKCDITLEDGGITNSHITLKADITGINEQKFQELAKKAKEECPISVLLDTELTLDAELV